MINCDLCAMEYSFVAISECGQRKEKKSDFSSFT